MQGQQGTQGPAGPSGIANIISVQDDNTMTIPAWGSASALSACIGTSSSAAVAGQKVTAFVTATCPIPPGHGLVIFLQYSTDGGTTWSGFTGSWAQPRVNNPSTTLTQRLGVSNSYTMSLTAGQTYTFATGLMDSAAGGYTATWPNGCSCQTTALVTN